MGGIDPAMPNMSLRAEVRRLRKRDEGLAPVLAYLDANPVEDVESLRRGVDEAMVNALRAAVSDGRLLIPFSDWVAMELMALAVKDAMRASALGRQYFALASRDVAFRTPKEIVRQAFEAHLGGPAVDPLMAITRGEQRRVKARLHGKAPRDIDRLAARSRAGIQDWLDAVTGYAAKARGLAGNVKSRPISDLMPALWAEGEIATTWASAMAESNGFQTRVDAAGLTGSDLLKIAPIAAAVGVMVGLACAQTVNGRKPDYGDFRDAQHCMLAASAGAVLVTHDTRLAALVEAIPGRPVTVMGLSALLRRL